MKLLPAVEPDLVDNPAPILQLPRLPPPSVRAAPPFDPEAALDAIHLAAGRLVAHLATLLLELERAPMPDADPDLDPGAVSRVSILRCLIDAAKVSATSVRVELSAIAPRQDAVERVQLGAVDTEALVIVLGHELERAPWRVSEGRIGLLVELVATCADAARLVRAGLGAIAERLAKER